MLAELLDAREAELRVVMVAESLPELAGEAAAKAVAEQADGLADVVGDTLDDFRAAVRAADLSSVAVMDGMRELLRRVEVTAEINVEDARLDGAARLEALKASVGRQLRPVTAAMTEIADYVAAAEEREAVRNRALKASITRQLQPLAAAVEAAVQHSDEQMGEIRARLDALGAPKVRVTKSKPKAKAAPAPAPAKKPPARRRAKPQAAAPEPSIEPDYDYKEVPAPAPPVVLNRRRPATRPRGSGPLAGA
jgi:DNA polymerase III gamma/tau subunit